MATVRPKVAVLGSGLLGLTTALELVGEHASYEVTVLSPDPLPESADVVRKLRRSGKTSAVATAIWHLYLVDPAVDPRILPWASRTYETLRSLSAISGTGIYPARGHELFRIQREAPPVWREIPRQFRMLDKVEVNAYNGLSRSPRHRVEWGYEMETYVGEMQEYLPWLAASLNCDFERLDRPIGDIREISDKFDLIVNCVGLGSKALFNDDNLVPVRGQYISFPRYEDAPGLYVGDDDHCAGIAYVIQVGGRVCVGGTEEHNEANLSFDESEANLIERVSDTSPWVREHYTRALAADDVERIVGLRPMRTGGVRLEIEIQNENRRPVIHNYGHGGSGFSLATGCAHSVRELVETVFT
jgi:D-amino-acid oxidase